MNMLGRVYNGVIILENGSSLPDGAAVTVCYPAQVARKSNGRKRIHVPLVRCESPGTVRLTGERITEILDEEDATPRC